MTNLYDFIRRSNGDAGFPYISRYIVSVCWDVSMQFMYGCIHALAEVHSCTQAFMYSCISLFMHWCYGVCVSIKNEKVYDFVRRSNREAGFLYISTDTLHVFVLCLCWLRLCWTCLCWLVCIRIPQHTQNCVCLFRWCMRRRINDQAAWMNTSIYTCAHTSIQAQERAIIEVANIQESIHACMHEGQISLV